MRRNFFIISLLLSSLYLCGGGVAQPVNDVQSYIEAAKAYFKQNLKDPFSVRFKDILVFTKAPNGKPVHGVCGQLNAKNSYGAYVGFRPFYYLVETGSGGIQGGRDGDLFKMFFKMVCDGKIIGTDKSSNG